MLCNECWMPISGKVAILTYKFKHDKRPGKSQAPFHLECLVGLNLPDDTPVLITTPALYPKNNP